MNDLISRQAAIEAITGLPNCPNGFSDTYDKARIIAELEEVPAIDAVEVVRCKDCIHKPYVVDVFHASYGDIPVLESNGKCPCINADDYFYSHMPDDDWFCANGERREADDH